MLFFLVCQGGNVPQNLPDQKHDERRGNFVEHGHVDVVLAQPRVPPNHGYQNRPEGGDHFSDDRRQF